MKFIWVGNEDSELGLAIYESATTRYEISLPTFKNAHDLANILNDIFDEGRCFGQKELKLAIAKVINQYDYCGPS